MKRRQIVSIFAALALTAGFSALLTGCSGKSYYAIATDNNGKVSYQIVSEIVSHTEGETAASTPASTTTTETTSSEAPEESSEAPEESSETPEESSETPEESSETPEESSETPEESSETPEEPSMESEEPSAETPSGDIETDENTLAVIKFEKPDDWAADNLYLRVYDDDSNKNTPEGQEMILGSDGLYYVVVSKIADGGNEFKNPHFMFLSVSQATGRPVQSQQGDITGSKTYGVHLEGRTFVLDEK